MNDYFNGDTVEPIRRTSITHDMSEQSDEYLSYASVDGLWLDGLKFCSEAYRLFELLSAESNATARLRLRPRSFERKLLTEILPLAHYLKNAYSLGRRIDICWHSGNQKFDAEFQQSGEFVKHHELPTKGFIEITTAQHPDEYLAREHLEAKGFVFSVHQLRATATKRRPGRQIISEPVVFSNGSFIDSMASFILKEIERKAVRGYPSGFTLIVQCTLNFLYLPNEWFALAEKVKQALPENDFGEIWMCADDRPNEYKAALQSK